VGVESDNLSTSNPSPRAAIRPSIEEVSSRVLARHGRPVVIVAATTGSDAHTVGMDSILSLKGRSGDRGLERYGCFSIEHLGSQVEPATLVARIREFDARIVLISQVVTQRDLHLWHFNAVREEIVGEGLRERVLLIGGGPGVTVTSANGIGYDATFGKGTRPSDVAQYILLAVESGRLDG
jgi:beta-lysine 5,6-aminomutase beta subunit